MTAQTRPARPGVPLPERIAARVSELLPEPVYRDGGLYALMVDEVRAIIADEYARRAEPEGAGAAPDGFVLVTQHEDDLRQIAQVAIDSPCEKCKGILGMTERYVARIHAEQPAPAEANGDDLAESFRKGYASGMREAAEIVVGLRDRARDAGPEEWLSQAVELLRARAEQAGEGE